jgi:hypothetical protein
VIKELSETGEVLDPEILRKNKDNVIGVGGCLTTEEEIFLLSLRLKAPECPNLDYIHQLDHYYRKLLSTGFISTRFVKISIPWFISKAQFKKRTLLRFLKYKEKMDMLWDHTMWNFLDEKHIVNHNALPKKGRADPLTGYIDFIPVTGNFRQSYNIFPIISGNPTKPRPVEYRIDQESIKRTDPQAYSFSSLQR